MGLAAEAVEVRPTPPAWAELLDAAHRLGADVVVCGTRGRGRFTRALLGSTSSSLVNRTDAPLLVVPDGGGALDGPVVVAYDGSDGASLATRAVGRPVGGRTAIVVHAWAPVHPRTLMPRAHRRRGRRPPRDDRASSGSARPRGEEDDAGGRGGGARRPGSTRSARPSSRRRARGGPWPAPPGRTGASFIAVGTRGHGAVRSALLGSVASGLVHNAELPVLSADIEP